VVAENSYLPSSTIERFVSPVHASMHTGDSCGITEGLLNNCTVHAYASPSRGRENRPEMNATTVMA